MKHLALTACIILAATLCSRTYALSASPGKDGPGGTLAGTVNTYYPGAATAAAGSTSITVGVPSGAATAIATGDLLLVIQMQDAVIRTTNDNNYGANNASGAGSTNVNNAGKYEYVVATSAVVAGVVTISGTNAGGLINTYTSTAFTALQGQRTFQVVRVPQYYTATLGSALTALPWNGSVGGILAIDVESTLTLGGTVNLDGTGFRGGGGRKLTGDAGANTDFLAAVTLNTGGSKGEGIAGTPRFTFIQASGTLSNSGIEGYPSGSADRGAPANGGGGGTDGHPVGNDENSGGGGGGNSGAGGGGGNSWNSNLAVGGVGGVSSLIPGVAKVILGGGGGAGTSNNGSSVPNTNTTGINSSGAAGGGIVLIRTNAVTGAGTITANGAAALNVDNDGAGGGGAGGSIVVITVNGTLAGLTASAKGGRGGDANTGAAGAANRHGPGGGGGGGLIVLTRAPAASNITAGVHGVTITTSEAYGSTTGSAGSLTSNATPGQVPGAISGGQADPASFSVSGFTNPAVAGVPQSNLTVAALDGFGRTVTGYVGTVTFASTDAQAVLPVNYTFVAGDAGSHTFSATLKTAGITSITTTDTTTASITGTQSGIVVTPGSAASYVVAGFANPSTAGVPSNFTVTVKDAFGNTVTGYTGVAKFSSNDPQAVLPADYTFTAADNGTQTFSGTLKTSGSDSLTVTDSAAPAVTGNQTVAVNAATAATFAVTGFPNPATAAVAGNLTVKAKDAFGNVATGYTGTVALASSDANAVLPASYTFAAGDNGTHSFSATLKTAGTQSISANDSASGVTGNQSGILVKPGAMAGLLILFPGETAAPGTVTGKIGTPDVQGIGSQIPLTVKAIDSVGNVVTTATPNVAVTSTDPSASIADDNGAAPGNLTLAAGSGVLSALSFPTAGTPTVTVKDPVTGFQATSMLTIATFRFLTTILPGATAGMPYTTQVVTANAGGPVAYSITGGSLPAGLSIDPVTGIISGQPVAPGSSTFTVVANDGSSAIKLNTGITVAAADGGGGTPSSGVVFTIAGLPNGIVGTDYQFPLTFAGGAGPFIFSASNLPPGLSLNGATGLIDGNPTSPGTFDVTLSVLDTSNNTTNTITLPLTITPADSTFHFGPDTLTGGQVGTPYTDSIKVTDAPGPVTFSATGLPVGLSLDPNTGAISGTPAPGSAGTYLVPVTATSGSDTINTVATLIIAPSPASQFYLTNNFLPPGLVGIQYGAPSVVAIETHNPGPAPVNGLSFAVAGLPDGLVVDPSTGAITGMPDEPGSYPIVITATDTNTNSTITTQRLLVILPPSGGDSNNLPNNVWISKETLKKNKKAGKDSVQVSYIFNTLRSPKKIFSPKSDPFIVQIGVDQHIDITPPTRSLVAKKWKFSYKSPKTVLTKQVQIQMDYSAETLKVSIKNTSIDRESKTALLNSVTLSKKTFGMSYKPNFKGPASALAHNWASFVVASAKLTPKAPKADSLALKMYFSDPLFQYPSKSGSKTLRIRLLNGPIAIADKTFEATSKSAIDKVTKLTSYKLKNIKSKDKVNVLSAFSLDSRTGKAAIALKGLTLGLPATSTDGINIGVELTVGDKAYYTGVTFFARKKGSYSTKLP